MSSARKCLSFLLMFFLLSAFTPAAAQERQEKQECFFLQGVKRVGPLNPNTVKFEGTDEDFTMTFLPEYDGYKASYPNAQWEVHVQAGTAVYRQPTPPGSMDIKFTPPVTSWCVGEEKRFSISGKISGAQEGLNYRYTPRFNYSTIFAVTTTSGVNPFENSICQNGDFFGEGGLQLLTANWPEIQIEYLVETAFGGLILEYHYKLAEPGQSVPPGNTSSTIEIFGMSPIALIMLILVIVSLLLI
jgi:hypothetical protein